MHLIRAESYGESNTDLATAIADINAIRAVRLVLETMI